MEAARDTNSLSIVIFGFVLGIFISSFVSIHPLVGILFVLVGVSVLVGEKIWEGRVEKEVLIIGLLLISFGFGALRYAVKDFHEAKYPTAEGLVIEEPEQRENATRFVFESDNSEKVLVTTDLYSPVEYGDRVKVGAEFKTPGVIEDFDYGAYLAKDDIYYTASFATVEVISKDNGNPLKSFLFRIKNSFIRKAKEILSEPESSLLMGLIIAGREALPKDILEEFRRAGVIHIVVLSGFNITIIAEFLRRVFQKIFIWFKWTGFPQGPAFASIVGIVLFTLMTGASATIVRAAIMALVVIGAKFLGRTYSAPRALIFAAFIMLLFNPKLLVFDPSFQLSFLATIGMIYLVPPIYRNLSFLPLKFNFRETVAQTLGTQAAVFPLLIYSVGSFSPVFLFSNVLILPVVPYTMLLGFIATTLAYLNYYLALPFAFVSHLMLSWVLAVAHVLG